MVAYLNERELASIRGELEGYMDSTCSILVKSNEIDTSGNVLEVHTEIADVPCRWVTLEKLEGIFGGQAFERELNKAWYKVYFAYDAAVEPGNILRKDGHDYSVVRTFGDQTYPLVKQAMVVDMEGDII